MLLLLPPRPEDGEVSDRAPVTEDEAPEDGVPEDATVEASAHDEETAASETKVSGSSVEGSSSSHTSTSPPEAMSPDKRKRKRSSDAVQSDLGGRGGARCLIPMVAVGLRSARGREL